MPRTCLAQRLDAALHAVAARRAAHAAPPAAKITRKAAAAAGHIRTRQARAGTGRSCSRPGILSSAVSRAKIDNIDAR
jgi:hypothetical protein